MLKLLKRLLAALGILKHPEFKKCSGCGKMIPKYMHCCRECYYEYHESRKELADDRSDNDRDEERGNEEPE